MIHDISLVRKDNLFFSWEVIERIKIVHCGVGPMSSDVGYKIDLIGI